MGKNQWEVAPLVSVSKDSKIAFSFDQVFRDLKDHHQNVFSCVAAFETRGTRVSILKNTYNS